LLSSVSFDEFGFASDLSGEALPLLTYRVLSRIPDLVTIGGVALGGLWWLTKRKNVVAQKELGGKAETPGGRHEYAKA